MCEPNHAHPKPQKADPRGSAHDPVRLLPAPQLRVDAGPDGATAWVTTTPGLEAVTADLTRIRPPWAQ